MSAATELSGDLSLGTRIYYRRKGREFELKGNFYHNLSISAEMLDVCPGPPNWGTTDVNLVNGVRNVEVDLVLEPPGLCRGWVI